MSEKTGARSSESAKPVKKAAPKKADPLARAGGHVDRGDGKGWVLDEED